MVHSLDSDIQCAASMSPDAVDIGHDVVYPIGRGFKLGPKQSHSSNVANPKSICLFFYYDADHSNAPFSNDDLPWQSPNKSEANPHISPTDYIV